jgi:hypothetical protein
MTKEREFFTIRREFDRPTLKVLTDHRSGHVNETQRLGKIQRRSGMRNFE